MPVSFHNYNGSPDELCPDGWIEALGAIAAMSEISNSTFPPDTTLYLTINITDGSAVEEYETTRWLVENRKVIAIIGPGDISLKIHWHLSKWSRNSVCIYFFVCFCNLCFKKKLEKSENAEVSSIVTRKRSVAQVFVFVFDFLILYGLLLCFQYFFHLFSVSEKKVSASATSPLLSDPVNFPHFLRTCPSDDRLAHALSDFITEMV